MHGWVGKALEASVIQVIRLTEHSRYLEYDCAHRRRARQRPATSKTRKLVRTWGEMALLTFRGQEMGNGDLITPDQSKRSR